MLIEMSFKELIAEKRFQGLTENSVRSYENLFRHFGRWLQENDIEHTQDLTSQTIKAYLLHCKENGNKPKTFNSKLKLIRAWVRWMLDEEIIEKDICKNIKLVREDDSPKIVREEDIQLALRHLRRMKRREDSLYSIRNHAIMITLIGTGLRVTELVSLDWNDIDFNDWLITIQKSKSRRSGSVPLSEALAKELKVYKSYVDNRFKDMPEAVFVNNEGERLTKNGVQLFIKRLKKELGIKGTFSPHAMRNVFIKRLLLNKANLREIQLLARHSKIEVTRQYIGYFQHELKEVLDEHDPLKGLL
ncbi:tyrosine-type recombinase/integrase [Halobacillus litoralis]|uniref:tyrosine-type recombinase/integrase n=1 Tax=Halobacillus litoralis TaxID=45668 RepID=UPI001CD4EF9A|nr:tyrosine-type recombinase/integrase [Halobacillus litoralis]MCA0971861.1 tyrosine-type recombinase/integrase [Halobacillus litoralis]